MHEPRYQPERAATDETEQASRHARADGRHEAAGGGWVDVKRRNLLTRTIGTFALLAGLYFGRDVLVPLAVAGVLALVLTPIVNRLERWGMANGFAVLSVVGVAMSALIATGVLVSNQGAALLDSLPQYRTNIMGRIDSIVHTDSGVLGRTADLVGDIRGEIAKEIKESNPDAATDETPVAALGVAPSPTANGDIAPGADVLQRLDDALTGSGPPIAVAVKSTDSSPLASARAMVGPLLAPVAGAGIVFIFVIFFLLSRRDLKDRFLQLAGRGHLHVTSAAIDEASMRISKYLLAHLSLNVAYGIAVWLVLWALDLPGAALWGLLAALLRFIPYVGPWLSALLPVGLSLAVYDGWTQPMYVAGTFIALELVSNNLLEPWVYGSRSGLSTVAVLLATLFWGWLWGAVGIVLAVPLTVIVVVLGRYLPQLAPFTILFGDEKSLPEGVRFYHRVLAGDEAGAMQLAKAVRSSRGMVGLADELLVPGTAEEKRDRLNGTLDPILSDRYWEFIEDVVANFVVADEGDIAPVSPDPEARPWTWCVPVSDDAELLNARLLAILLRTKGQRADVVKADELDTAGAKPARIVVLACAPLDQGQLRRTVRAVRGAAASSTELAVHVAGQAIHTHLAERLARLGVTHVTSHLAGLVDPETVEPTMPASAVKAGVAQVRPARPARPTEAANAGGSQQGA